MTLFLSVILFLSLIGLAVLFVDKRKKNKSLATYQNTEIAPPQKGAKLSERLKPTKLNLKSKLDDWASKGAENNAIENLEEILLEADVGVKTTAFLIETVKEHKNRPESIRSVLRNKCIELLSKSSNQENPISKPHVISVVGINGAGKTTTIGKLARIHSNKNQTVLLGALDTFRAGATSQLKAWGERTGSQVIAGREGGDPGAIAFDTLSAAKARNVDVVILDTAGRLHTKSNLMEELKKIHRVMKKVIPEAPHETLLVLDATIGQNSLQQSKEFQKSLDITGIILTKLDGTARGGALFSISSELNIPVKYIGIGESVEDLIPFDPKSFVDAILDFD